MIWCQRFRWFFKFNFNINRLKGAIFNIHFYCIVSRHIFLVRVQYILYFSWNVRPPPTFSHFLGCFWSMYPYVCLFFVHRLLEWNQVSVYRLFIYIYIYLCVFVCLRYKVYQLNAGKPITPDPSSRFSTCRFIRVSRYGEFSKALSFQWETLSVKSLKYWMDW